MIQICPNCRSTFNLIDKVDIKAPSLQEISCPVCGQKIWKSSGWVMPKRWSVGEIIKRHPEEGKPPEAQVFEQTIPKEAEKPAWNIQLPDFGGIAKLPGEIGTGLKIGAAIGIVLLIVFIIFIISRRT